MPISDIHQRKKMKNFIILGAIAAWIVLIWVITMIKIANA
jgi:hypothetical protein